jgi:hypothetical protein
MMGAMKTAAERLYRRPVPDLFGIIDSLTEVLLAVEWSGMAYRSEDDDGEPSCPVCLRAKVEGEGHYETCALDAALRKAGVR